MDARHQDFAAPPTGTKAADFDVIVVGAGLSGIAAAYHLQRTCPNKRYAVLEARQAIGGTWDLFRYPGIRSDSDMFTLGFSFRPWPEVRAIVDGTSIRSYLEDTARTFGIDRHIQFGKKIVSADWSSANAAWTLEVASSDGAVENITCRFLITCTGYYDYAGGHAPRFPDEDAFEGRLVHPQLWPRDLDYAGKKVVVIGSGATAISLVPAMAQTAAHVTMLQRSPSYVVSRSAEDDWGPKLKRFLPDWLTAKLVRGKYILTTYVTYALSRRYPEKVKAWILQGVRDRLGGAGDVADFTPHYKPWDQRVCVVPDGDLFEAIRAGSASVVTDRIEQFVPGGIALASGRKLDADIIVSATGLKLQMLGGMKLTVGGRAVAVSDTFSYQGMLYSGIPNLGTILGTTNASWTLRAELNCQYLARLMRHMDKHDIKMVVPKAQERLEQGRPILDLEAGYVSRALHLLPKQASRAPWRARSNYFLDAVSMSWTPHRYRGLEFS